MHIYFYIQDIYPGEEKLLVAICKLAFRLFGLQTFSHRVWKNYKAKLSPLGIMGFRLRAPLKPLEHTHIRVHSGV